MDVLRVNVVNVTIYFNISLRYNRYEKGKYVKLMDMC